MSPLVSNINQILSFLTIISQVAIIGLLALFFLKQEKILAFFQRKTVLFSLVIALIATLGSLFYSEIAEFEPCKLCWFQRILMYPQVILLAIALLKKNEDIASYILGLSIPGAIIAGYHYLLQIGVAPDLACSAVGYSISCSQRFVMNFGYITIPMISFSAFLLIILIQLAGKGYNKKVSGTPR